MPTRPTPPKPWKVLLLSLAVCTLLFVLAIAGVAYWFISFSGLHREPEPTLVQEEFEPTRTAGQASEAENKTAEGRANLADPIETLLARTNSPILSRTDRQPDSLP